MSMMDKLKALVGNSPDTTKQGVDKASSAADEQTGGKHSDKIDQAGEQAPGNVDPQSDQDGPQQGGQGGGPRQ